MDYSDRFTLFTFKMKLKHLIIFILLISQNLIIYSQKSCLNTLREAKELYEQGLIDEIPDLLNECMISGFTRTQRIEAYKLIILAYLFDDDQFAAEKMMDDFLKKFPEYEIMPNDPVEFVYLLESYKTSSFYSLNLTFGPTFSNRRIIEHYSAMNISQTEASDRIGTGFQIGFGVSRNLWKNINGNIGVIYSINNYSSTERTNTLYPSQESSFADLSAEERITLITIPVSFTYSFGRGNLNYFGRLGGSAGFLNNASITLSRSQPEIETISETFEDITDKRNNLYFAAVIGAGLEYKIPRGFLVLDIRYQLGINNMLVGDRYSIPRFASRYFYVDDDFILDYVSISFGYHFSIYQSKKNRF